MLGSEFVREFAGKGPIAWEAAAIELARQGSLVPWPTFDLSLADDAGNTAILTIPTDLIAIGTIADHVRLPMTPSGAQSIANLTGSLLPTPWLVYQIWRAAPIKLRPIAMVPNRFQDLRQFAQHDALIDAALEDHARTPDQAAAGLDKHVVISNLMKPDRVVIFGWYEPDGPDVFDDRRPMGTPGRQPRQPLSNIHAASYWDYSHGIQLIGSRAIVNGQPMSTADLYRHPVLSKLVSNEGPLRVLRYPSPVAPVTNLAAIAADDRSTISIVRSHPSASELGFDLITGPRRGNSE